MGTGFHGDGGIRVVCGRRRDRGGEKEIRRVRRVAIGLCGGRRGRISCRGRGVALESRGSGSQLACCSQMKGDSGMLDLHLRSGLVSR